MVPVVRANSMGSHDIKTACPASFGVQAHKYLNSRKPGGTL